MKCTRKIPEECFTCPFPDCKADNNPNLQERLYLRVEPEKPSRAEYFAEYYKNLSPEQKARRRARAKEWNRLHQKEQTIKRREYFREYRIKRREMRNAE